MRIAQFPAAFYLAIIAAHSLHASAQSDFSHQQAAFSASNEDTNATRGGTEAGKVAITPEISTFVERTLKESNVPGLTAGFVRLDADGSVLTEFGSWGKMNEDGSPVRQETLFSIGSCSKAFFATALGLLMDDFAQGVNVTTLPAGVKTFTWETKVKSLLPAEDWELADEWATEKLNLRDALSHVSGLPRHDLSYSREDTPLDVVRRLRHLKPFWELRQQWSYNNQMFVLAAHILELYSGKTVAEFVEDRIFVPLNMTSSTYSPTKAESTGHLSQTWSLDGRRIPYWFADESSVNMISGAGGIISDVSDMMKWIGTMLNGGVEPRSNRTIIPPPLFDLLTASYMIVSGTPTNRRRLSLSGYSSGWARESVQGHDRVSHSGGLPGFVTEVWFFPEDRIGIFTSSNTVGPASNDVAFRIVEDYLGLARTASTTQPEPEPQTYDAPEPPSTQPPPPDPQFRSDVDLTQFDGTYSNPGYGDFTLCTAQSILDACAPILCNFSAVYPGGVLDPTTLYGGWARARLWLSHFRLSLAAGASDDTRRGEDRSDDGRVITFGLTAGQVFPRGYGRDETPFVYEEMAGKGLPVECVLSNDAGVFGCGMMNIAIMDTTWKSRTGSVRERADAWFERV